MTGVVDPAKVDAPPPVVRRQLLTLGRFVGRSNWAFWVALVAVLVTWQIVAQGLSNSLIAVPPTDILARGKELWDSGELRADLAVSGTEFLLGFSVATVAGVGIGLLSGNYKRIGNVVDPFVSAVYAMPIIALAPLFIIALGIGVASKVAVVALSAFFPIVLNTTAGVRGTDAAYRDLGRAFTLSEIAIFVKVIVPYSIPFILAGLRVATGRGLTAVLAAELFGSRDGLGLMILTAASQFDTAAVFVGVVIFATTGAILTKVFYRLELHLAPWRRDE